MPDVAEGLESGGEQIDPNSDQGFAASLASTLGKELDPAESQRLEEGERSVESGLEVEEPSAPTRDAQGRFAAVDTVVEELAETPPTDEEEPLPAEETPPAEDPWKQRYEELNSVLGRQGQELGELRRALAEREQQPQAPPDLPVLTEEDQSRLDQFISRDPKQAMLWLAENRHDLIEHGYQAWMDTGDPEASSAWTRYQAILASQMSQPQQPVQPGLPPDQAAILQEMSLQRRLVSSLEAVKASAPDWEQIGPHFADAFDAAPDNVKQLVISQDPNLHNAGVFAIISDARVRATQKLASQAAQGGAQRQAEAVAAKTSAGLTRGGMRPVAQRPAVGEAPADETSEQKSERVRAALHQAILNTETTDVMSGLTFE